MSNSKTLSSTLHPEALKAIDLAKGQLHTEGLVGRTDEDHEVHYTLEQGAKAACYGREDAAATLIMSHALLHQLDTLKRLAWVCIALLAYIAFRVS